LQKKGAPEDIVAIAREALRDMLFPYLQIGKPSEAVNFFSRWGASEKELERILLSLATEYEQQGDCKAAGEVCRGYLSRFPDNKGACNTNPTCTSKKPYVEATPKMPEATIILTRPK
jgi:hypothetical protein